MFTGKWEVGSVDFLGPACRERGNFGAGGGAGGGPDVYTYAAKCVLLAAVSFSGAEASQ